MRPCPRIWARRGLLSVIAAAIALGLTACGGLHPMVSPHTQTNSNLPGKGKPNVTIGDKNFTEQFILGELYFLALRNEGFSVSLNQNIGPLEVTMQELRTGQLAMYPEYLNTWDTQIAHASGPFPTRQIAYQTGQSYATAHGFQLLDPTPFSNTDAVGVTFDYAVQKGLTSIGDLSRLGRTITFGGPPQFEGSPTGLPALKSAYQFRPKGYKSLEIGEQYKALDSGQVQAADVSTTDAALSTGNYTLLSDPLGLFGFGNVVPVVSAHALAIEGPAFANTINEVSSLLTTKVIRQLNAQVDISGRDVATVAAKFLAENGLG